MGGGAISWLSKRQSVVAASTAEAEYTSLFHTTQQAAWLQRLVTDIDNNNGVLPIQVLVDNQSAIAMSKNASINPQTKHIDIKYNFVREAATNGTINIKYCLTANMVADCLTKTVSRANLEENRKLMGSS